MIENEISINGKFAMKVHFNLRKKKGSAKSQIWLTTTIDGERAQVYTGQRIEEKYWTANIRGYVDPNRRTAYRRLLNPLGFVIYSYFQSEIEI